MWSNTALLNAVDNHTWASGMVPTQWQAMFPRHQFRAAQQCLMAWEGAPIPRRIVDWLQRALHMMEEGVVALANDDPSFSFLAYLDYPVAIICMEERWETETMEGYLRGEV